MIIMILHVVTIQTTIRPNWLFSAILFFLFVAGGVRAHERVCE